MLKGVKRQARAALDGRLRRAGYDLIRHPAHESMAWLLRAIIDQYGIETVVDVGAHEGGFAQFLRDDVRFQGTIVSFEPAEKAFGILVDRFASDRRWSGRRVAIGDRDGRVDLHNSIGTNFNSILTPSEYGVGLFRGMTAAGSESVPLRRLDVELSGLRGASLLKSDTQGYDLAVIRGAEGIIDRFVAVVVEVSVRALYDDAPDFLETLSFLRDLGYDPCGFFPVIRGRDTLNLVEFDAVLARRDAPVAS